MSEELRLFIAVELPAEIRQALADAQRRLRTADVDASWSRPETIHLTLKFIGKTPPEHVERLCGDIDRAAADCLAHRATLAAELGAFPGLNRIRVVWAGLNEPTGELLALQKRIDTNTSWWSPPETRPFAPHLTLARVKSGRNIAALSQLIRQLRMPADLHAPVEQVILFSSQLAPGGAVHTPLHRAPLSVL